MKKTKAAMIEAMSKSLGIVQHAAAKVAAKTGSTTEAVARSHYRWLKDDEEYKEAIERLEDETLDFVESKLFELINGVKVQGKNGEMVYKRAPDKTSIIFYLKTKGRKRDYIERKEFDLDPDQKNLAMPIVAFVPAMDEDEEGSAED